MSALVCQGTPSDAVLRLRGNHFVGCLGDVTLSGNSGRVTSLDLTRSKLALQDGCPDHCHMTTGDDKCDDVITRRRCVNNYVTGSCDCSLSSDSALCQRGRNLNNDRSRDWTSRSRDAELPKCRRGLIWFNDKGILINTNMGASPA